MIRLYENLKRRFYAGPAIFNYPGRKLSGYRSPTLLLYWWLESAAATWFTLPGRVFLVLTGFFLLAGIMSILMPMFLLSFSLAALFIANIVIGFLVRPRLTVRRSLPESAPANAPIRFDYEIRNERNRPVWDVYLDAVPLPRNLHFADGRPYLAAIGPGETVTHTAHITASARGKYELPVPLADSAFPFGLWRWGSRGAPNRPLLVYPDFTPLRRLTLPVGARYQPGGEMTGGTASESLEFQGCREYRYGDSVRHLHALSSARLRQPIIKEFRDEYLSRVALLVDVQVPPRPALLRLLRPASAAFEAAMSLSAAVADHLTRENYHVDLFVPGAEEAIMVAGGAGPDQLQGILSVVAGLSPVATGDGPGLPPEFSARLGQIGAAVLILLAWDEPRQALARALRESGMALRILIVSRQHVDVPDDGEVTLLRPATILTGAAVEL